MSNSIEEMRRALDELVQKKKSRSQSDKLPRAAIGPTIDPALLEDAGIEARWTPSEHPARSFGSRSPTVPHERITWAGEEGQTGEVYVAQVVAKAFGKRPRSFADAEHLSNYIADLVDRCALARIIKLLEARERSSLQLEKRLKSDGFTDDAVARAIERATRSGLVDDMRYADVFIRSKVYQGWGAYQIERALAEAGIEAHEVPGYPDEYFYEQDEYARAMQLIAHKRIADKNPEQKLARYLVSKGYSYETAFQAAHERVSQDLGHARG